MKEWLMNCTNIMRLNHEENFKFSACQKTEVFGMKIGLDMDEVITSFVDTYLPYYNKNHGTDWKKEDIYSYYLYEVFGISKEEDTKSIVSFGETEEYKNMPLIEGAADGIRKLSRKNELYIITGRPFDRREITEEAIRKNFNNCFKGLFFTDFKAERGHAVPKHTICNDLGIELMIDDMPSTAEEIYNYCNIPIIMPEYPWNKNFDIHGTKISRVNGWKGIMKYCRESL